MDKILPSLRLNERVATTLSYLIVSGMVIFLLIIVVRFGQALLPTWDGSYLVLLGFLVALETFYTQRMRKNLTVLDQEWFIFYLAEFVVLVLLLKGFQLLAGGIDGLWSQISAMSQDFGNGFFNSEFLFSLLLLLIIWMICLSFSAPLEILRVSPRNLFIEEDVGSFSERSNARQQLVDQVLLVGLVMVALASLMRSDRTAGWFQVPDTRIEVISILFYFILGLVLLSLTQYSVMQMRWAVNRIPTSQRLASNWVLFGVLFLTVLAGISVLLPTRYSISLLTLLNWLVGFLFMVIQLLNWLLLTVVMLAAYFLGLLSGEQSERELPAPYPLPTPVSSSNLEGIDIPVVEWIGSIVFWATIIGLVVYLLVYFFRTRQEDVSRIVRLPLISKLVAFLRIFMGWFGGMRNRVSHAVKAGVQRLRQGTPVSLPPPNWGYTSLRRMSPRQRVLFYYLALVRRGTESGAPRQDSQTPYEYEARLADILSIDQSQLEARVSDLQTMTDRFVEARYSRHLVSAEQANIVRQSWQRLKHVIRRASSSILDR